MPRAAASWTLPPPSSVGASFADLCTDPRCPACWLWPRAGEAFPAFLARLRAQPVPPTEIPIPTRD